jgi:hypothetical protein
MEAFDPLERRRRLDGRNGHRWDLSFSFDEFRDDRALASCANHYLTTAVYCLLVGYDAPAKALLARAHEWVTIAIRDDERPSDDVRGGTEGSRHLTLALCNWLRRGEHDNENYALYIEHYDPFLVREKHARNKMQIGLVLPEYLDARAYTQALVRFADAGMKPPVSLARVRSEAQMSYVLCRHYLTGEYDPAELDATIKRFLKYNVNHWLIDGHALRAAQWMKIAHWSGEETPLAARAAVLACYDYLAASPPEQTSA